jgi:hypothetical protein
VIPGSRRRDNCRPRDSGGDSCRPAAGAADAAGRPAGAEEEKTPLRAPHRHLLPPLSCLPPFLLPDWCPRLHRQSNRLLRAARARRPPQAATSAGLPRPDRPSLYPPLLSLANPPARRQRILPQPTPRDPLPAEAAPEIQNNLVWQQRGKPVKKPPPPTHRYKGTASRWTDSR